MSEGSMFHTNGRWYAYNRTRQTFVATQLRVAKDHFSRMRGLLGTPAHKFGPGNGLWIVPCHGVHTIAMRFPIDVVYLDPHCRVVHLAEGVRPWRVTPVKVEAATVLELPSRTIWNTGTSVGDIIEIRSAGEQTKRSIA